MVNPNSILTKTHFNFPNQISLYNGKVRDVYEFENQIFLVATDRISAFDVILPRAIPFKGQILNQIAAYFLTESKEIVPNWFLDSPDPNVSIGKKAEAYPVEIVVRAYLAGHSWRVYKDGGRILCGVTLPEGLKENDRLPNPMITPSTKAKEGHDEDISREEIIEKGLVKDDEYAKIEEMALKLFEVGTKMAKQRGLILVDTKYEFGKIGEEIVVIDEIHTPDSSRYFYSEGYDERQEQNLPQKQLSKEFVREWLIQNGFQGKENQVIPEMSDEWVTEISDRYIELYEKITGKIFEKTISDNILVRIEANLKNYVA